MTRAAALPVRPVSALRNALTSEAGGGLVLTASAALALVVANSPPADTDFAALKTYLGPLSVLHRIDDALMAVFFLLVGLEIKREVLDGRLRTWPDRVLPGLAALGGMAAPALVYAAVNWNSPETLRGCAIPAATDIAFALSVLALLGSMTCMAAGGARAAFRPGPHVPPLSRDQGKHHAPPVPEASSRCHRGSSLRSHIGRDRGVALRGEDALVAVPALRRCRRRRRQVHHHTGFLRSSPFQPHDR